MSTRALFPILFASLVTPVLVAAPTSDAIAQQVRALQIRSRNDHETYTVKASTPGEGSEQITHVDVQFLESFGGPDPFEDAITITNRSSGFELLAPNAGEPIEFGLGYEVNITPLGDDGSPVGETVYLDGALNLGGGPTLVNGVISFSPDQSYNIIRVGVGDTYDCFDCIAVELEPTEGTPADFQPGPVQIQGESVTASTSPYSAPPRTLDAVSESHVATYFWDSEPISFYEDAIDHAYLLNVELRNIDGQLVSYPTQHEVVVEAGGSDDPGPVPTIIIDGDHDGDVQVGADDIALVTGNVTGNITVSGGTLILTGSTVTGDIIVNGGNIEFNDHSSIGLLETAGDVSLTGGGGASFTGPYISGGGAVELDLESDLLFGSTDLNLSSLNVGGGSVYIPNASQLSVVGGNIEFDEGASWNVGGNSSIDITGGDFIATGRSTLIYAQDSTIEITGGDFIASDSALMEIGGESTMDVHGNLVWGEGTSHTAELTTWNVRQDGHYGQLEGELGGGDVDLRVRGDGGSLSINGVVNAEGTVDFRTTGEGSPLTLGGDITADAGLSVRTQGDDSNLVLGSADGSGATVQGDVVLRTMGARSDRLFWDNIEVVGGLDIVGNGDGDINVRGTLTVGGDVFARTRNGGDFNVPCDLTRERGICLFAEDVTVVSDGNIDLDGGIAASIVDLDAGGDVTVNGDVNSGDMFLYGGGHRGASTTRIGGLCVLTGLARIDSGSGDTVVDGTLDVQGHVILTSGNDTTINGTVTSSNGEVDVQSDGGIEVSGLVQTIGRNRLGFNGGFYIAHNGTEMVSGGDIDIDADTTVEIDGVLSAQSGSIALYAGDGTTLTEGTELDWLDYWAEVVGPTDLDGGSWIFEGDTPQYNRRRRRRHSNSDIVTINIYDGDRNAF